MGDQNEPGPVYEVLHIRDELNSVIEFLKNAPADLPNDLRFDVSIMKDELTDIRNKAEQWITKSRKVFKRVVEFYMANEQLGDKK